MKEEKFDARENLIWKKCPNGYIYDENNKIYNGKVWEYRYDKNGNRIWEKDPDGKITEYKYDENNNLIWKKNSDGEITEYKYDKKDNKKKWEKPIDKRLIIL